MESIKVTLTQGQGRLNDTIGVRLQGLIFQSNNFSINHNGIK